MRNKLTGMSEVRAMIVKYEIREGRAKHKHSLRVKTQLMSKRHFIFITLENSASPFPFQNRCSAWHGTVLCCKDHLVVVLCNTLGSAASEKGHRLSFFATRTVCECNQPQSSAAHSCPLTNILARKAFWYYLLR